MKTSNLFTVLAAILILAPAGFAFNDSLPSHALGFNGGLTTGVGLSYRFWPTGAFGLQATVLPVYTQDSEGSTTFLSLGTTLFHRIHRSGNVRLLGFASCHTIYVNEEWNNSVYDEEGESVLMMGIGPAIEYETGSLTITIGTGYMYTVPISVDRNVGLLSYTFELGFHYAFGPKVPK